MSDCVIKTNNLSKRFLIGSSKNLTLFKNIRHKITGEIPKKAVWALKDINICVEKGEMVAIIGPNGAGKTTLLRLLAGIMDKTSGTYVVSEEVSTIFELGLGFNKEFTALENIYLYSALHGMTRKEINKLLDSIIEFSGLGDFIYAKLRDYSTGMIQRLAFATVIQTAKGIIMVDEVLAVGDIAFQQKCLNAFKKSLDEGNTILYVTHGLGNSQYSCTKALYLNAGKQIAYGEVEEVEEKYETDLVMDKIRELD